MRASKVMLALGFDLECLERDRAVFIWVIYYATWLAQLNSRHLFIQTEVKPKPIVSRSHTFSRDSRELQVITSSFDWFTGL